jgi:DNA topoisomerase-3
MPQLIVAEKPSVARDLAKVLGANKKGAGCLEGSGYIVTWCRGHMAELCDPEHYNADWKRWTPQALPMLPDQFEVQPRKDVGAHWKELRALLHRKDAEVVINACDAGREGELIFRYVYEMARCNKPVLRLWLSSLTEEAITHGMNALRPGADFDPLADAARSRSEADWLVGLNATRAMTLLNRRGRGAARDSALMSVGRVQTPTLAMIVEREDEIVHFKPEPFWQVFATFESTDGPYEGMWHKGKDNRLDAQDKAVAVADAVRGQVGHVLEVQQRKVSEKPPLLHDLTQLQRTANQRYGMSAAKTLEVAQALYEKHKLLTYPRTDSNYLTTDMKPKLPGIIKGIAVGAWAPFCQTLQGAGALKTSPRIINDKEVGDHHAIIPTGKTPRVESLDQDEARIFDLVARRFLAVFFPDAIFATTRIETDAAGHRFITTGRVRKVAGWQEVDPPPGQKPQEGQPEEATLLPDVQQGERPPVIKDRVHKGMTQPPKRYNEGTLLRAMELAGKELEDKELRRVMKDAGIGTPATRASIIETLLKRNYLQRQGKNLVPTPDGQALIKALPVDVLKSPKLTGAWEERLTRMAEGNYARAQFMAQVREFTTAATARILGASPPPARASTGPDDDGGGSGESLGPCPVCQSPVTEQFKTYHCARGRDCTFVIFKVTAGRKMSPNLVKLLLSGKTSQKLQGFQSKQGKRFEAAVRLDETGKLSFVFEHFQEKTLAPPPASPPPPTVEAEAPPAPRPPAGTGWSCPVCEEGEVIQGRKGWGCSRWREGCGFVLWYEQRGRRLSHDEAAALLTRGATDWLDGFEGDHPRARLVLAAHGDELVRLEPPEASPPTEPPIPPPEAPTQGDAAT